MMTTSATAQLRQKLNIAFDDLTLSAFCQDYFRTVYDRFSEGMRKDNKIRLLLDHCSRQPTGFKRLLEAVGKEYSYAKQAASGKSNNFEREELKPLIDVLERLTSEPPPAQSAPSTAPQRAGICPFEYGSTVPPERFYGRDSQRADIKTRIGGISAQCISIVGLRRSGKSSLLRYIEERLDEFCRPEQQAFVVTIDLQDNRFQTPLDLVEGLRRGIKRQIGRPPWQRDENDDNWAVGDGLEELRDMGKQLIVLIDEFELLGSRLEVFQGWGKDWRSKASKGYFTLVIASLRPLEEIYRANGLSSPFGNIFHHTELGALTDDEWQRLVREGFARSGNDVSDADLALIYDLAGGWPYYTQMAATLLWQYRAHSQTRAAFIHQAIPRFAELWDDLKQNERQALRYAAGIYRGATPDTNLQAALQRYGLQRADGQPFSSPFNHFVRGQP